MRSEEDKELLALRYLATGASRPEVVLALERDGIEKAEAARLLDSLGTSEDARRMLASRPAPASVVKRHGPRFQLRAEHLGLLLGALLLGGGIWGTISSYSSAAPGGRFTIWWGAIVAGGWVLLKAIERGVQD